MLSSRPTHMIVRLMLAAAVLWFTVDGICIIRDFIYKYNGLRFYSRQPHLLAICVVVGVTLALGALSPPFAERGPQRTSAASGGRETVVMMSTRRSITTPASRP